MKKPASLTTLLIAADKLEPDALQLLVTIAERLVAGRATYGAMQIATDTRDLKQEAYEECVDGLVYAVMGLMRDGGAQ